MDRDAAINYLNRQGKLDNPRTCKERKFTKEEQKEIAKVVKEGKIYGDPMVVLNE